MNFYQATLHRLKNSLNKDYIIRCAINLYTHVANKFSVYRQLSVEKTGLKPISKKNLRTSSNMRYNSAIQ